MDQREFVEKLPFFPVTKERKKQAEEDCNEGEATDVRSSTGGAAWALKTRPDKVSEVHELQSAFSKPKVKDLVACNKVTRSLRDTASYGVLFRALPPGPSRLQLWPDGAKGDLKLKKTCTTASWPSRVSPPGAT